MGVEGDKGRNGHAAPFDSVFRMHPIAKKACFSLAEARGGEIHASDPGGGSR